MFSGFHLTGLPELLSTPHKVEITRRTFLKRILGRMAEGRRESLCVWMEKAKADGAAQWPHFTGFTFANPSLKSTQLPRMDRKDNWSWNRFSSPKIEKPQKPNFRWLAALVPSRMAERWRQTGSGGTGLGKAPHSSARRPNRPFAMHDAFCMMLLCRPEMRVWEPLWESDATILSVTHHVSSGSGIRRFCCHWRAGHQ